MEVVEILIPISFFAMVFGIFYLKSRENMALIAAGINPKTQDPAKPKPFWWLKIAMLLIGCGLGLLIAFFLAPHFMAERAWISDGVRKTYIDDAEELYPALIFLFGGLGLLVSYRIERKYWLEDREVERKRMVAYRDAVEA